MPKTELHKKKLKKNLTLLGLIFLWCAAIWAITMIKVARAQDMSETQSTNVGAINSSAAFLRSRTEHGEFIDNQSELWFNNYADQENERIQAREQNDAQRGQHHDFIKAQQDGWYREYGEKTTEREAKQVQTDERRTQWQDEMRTHPRKWWDMWSQSQAARKLDEQ